jgi:type II secretory pathway pseudopilin PulG
VVIIGILATLMFPAFATLRARAQRVQCTSNLRNLYLAADLFVQRNGSWPQIRMQGESDTAERD